MRNLLGELPIRVRLKTLVTPTWWSMEEMPLQIGVYDVICVAPDGVGLKIDAGWQCALRGGVWLHPSEYEVVAYGAIQATKEEVANA